MSINIETLLLRYSTTISGLLALMFRSVQTEQSQRIVLFSSSVTVSEWYLYHLSRFDFIISIPYARYLWRNRYLMQGRNWPIHVLICTLQGLKPYISRFGDPQFLSHHCSIYTIWVYAIFHHAGLIVPVQWTLTWSSQDSHHSLPLALSSVASDVFASGLHQRIFYGTHISLVQVFVPTYQPIIQTYFALLLILLYLLLTVTAFPPCCTTWLLSINSLENLLLSFTTDRSFLRLS